MSLLEKAKKMKGEKIKVRYIGYLDESNLTPGKVYNAIHDGLGSVGNALFCSLTGDDGAIWTGQLNGYDDFRMLLYPETKEL